jgi:lipoprotein-anchoring transpeptidase ErfK/SrfK
VNDDELGRLLAGAFDAQARSEVSDHAAPPRPRFLTEHSPDEASPNDDSRSTDELVTTVPNRHGRGVRLLAPLAAAAAVVLLVAGGVALSDRTSHHHAAVGSSNGPAATSAPTTHTTTAQAAPITGKPVHIKLLNSDGTEVGVGMPVIAYFSRKITSGVALQKATTVTVDNKPQKAAWYFEQSDAYPNYPYEAHLRLHTYWPADAQIHVAMPTRGLSAGKGMSFDDSLTLDFSTGDSHIAVVDDTTHLMTVTDNGKPAGQYHVSLGAADTPTSRGVKVIMEKGASICMHGPGYDQCGIKYTQRLTYSGEYLHAAPWNMHNIKAGIDSSNGCTNLTTQAARALYKFTRIGDVVTYYNANGPAMTLGQGYGDWNVSWAQWQLGGLVHTQ